MTSRREEEAIGRDIALRTGRKLDVMLRSAVITFDGVYRYRLFREWDSTRPAICFVMLNPSTADGEADDPTIRRCIGFAKRFGGGAIEVVNLFALRATDPRKLYQHPRPIGHENNLHIATAAAKCAMTICAWGTKGDYMHRNEAVRSLLSFNGVSPQALRISKGGHPEHPLYLPGNLQPVRLP